MKIKVTPTNLEHLLNGYKNPESAILYLTLHKKVTNQINIFTK